MMTRAGYEAAVGQAARQVERQRRRLAEDAVFRAAAAGRLHRQPQAGLADNRTGDLDRAGAGIERELEAAQREVGVDVRRRADRRRGVRAEERHLQAAVFFEIEAVALRYGLAHGEADFFAAVINTAPRGT